MISLRAFIWLGVALLALALVATVLVWILVFDLEQKRAAVEEVLPAGSLDPATPQGAGSPAPPAAGAP